MNELLRHLSSERKEIIAFVNLFMRISSSDSGVRGGMGISYHGGDIYLDPVFVCRYNSQQLPIESCASYYSKIEHDTRPRILRPVIITRMLFVPVYSHPRPWILFLDPIQQISLPRRLDAEISFNTIATSGLINPIR